MVAKAKGLEWRVIDFIQRHHLFSSGEKIVVAVSGGADSVCLLHILAQHRASLGLELHIAHLNHGLRGDEGDADAAHVLGLAHKLNLPVTVEKRDVAAYRKGKRLSPEEAAREVRYGFLAEVMQSVGAARVVVGHTRNDHVETVLLHLLRGTGLNGLRGLQPVSVLSFGGKQLEVVRPLLEVSRQETLEYCKRHELHPCFDWSNESLHLLRNRIRLELLPALREYNPSIDNVLVKLADIATADLAFIEERVARCWRKVAKTKKDAIYLDVAKIKALPLALQRQLMRRALEQLRGNLEDIGVEHIESMVEFLFQPAGKKLSLPEGITLSTEYGWLVLSLAGVSTCPLPWLEGSFKLDVPGVTLLPGWRVRADVFDGAVEVTSNGFVATFDMTKTGRDLEVRRRKPGDRFQPLGMSQSKKLQDFMVDARIPRSWRSRVPLVCSPQQILWVVGWRIDDRVKLTPDTRKVLRLEFQRSA